MEFVTMGMCILDDIDFLPPAPSVRGVLGGAGPYSAVGARIWSPPPSSGCVGFIVDAGWDFPREASALISSWHTSAVMRSNPDRQTTRGWNGYGLSENRSFRYLTPKRRLTAADLDPPLLFARSFHLICGPSRCKDLVAEIKSRRRAAAAAAAVPYSKPLFIWEPVPDLCTPEELLNCTNTLPLVDICSPNHVELAGFMGESGLDAETGEISKLTVERCCEQLLASMPLQSYTLVVRAGEKGCYVARNGGRRKKRRKREFERGGLRPDTDMEAVLGGLLQDADGIVAREEIELDPGLEAWIPPFYDVSQGDAVVDPTGAGNAFLGGLAVALCRGLAVEEASLWGAVSASFALEQVGLPALGKDEGGVETWNGQRPSDRLQTMKIRLKSHDRQE